MHVQTSAQAPLRLGIGEYCCNWGTHLCGLYETPAERDEMVYGFLHEGLRTDDVLAFVVSPDKRAEFVSTWTRRFSSDPQVAAGALPQLLSPHDLYFPDGSFSPWAMEAGLAGFYETSQRDGRRCIRSGADMDWALERVPGVEHLMAYEARLNLVMPGKPWFTICLYDLTRFSGATIMKVLQTHPFCLSGRVITENPYYRDPVGWLRSNAPQFLEAS